MSNIKPNGEGLPKPAAVTLGFPLSFLDGIRGLAALYVMVHHAFWELKPYRDKELGPMGWYSTLSILDYGHYAVGAFIVLSGFLLMLPVVNSSERSLRGGLKSFFFRRACRILPAYYMTLCFSLLIIFSVPSMHQQAGWRWDMALPAFTWQSVGTHLLMLHTFKGLGWTIDPVLWSVAVEWWIYVLFALLLVPVFRRAGIAGLFCTCLLLTLPFLLGYNLPLLATFQSYILLFGIGATAAWVSATYLTQDRAWFRCASQLAVVTSGALAAFFVTREGPLPQGPIADISVGLATAFIILLCLVERQRKARFAPLLSVLESQICRTLGAFSYSLYLVHFPLLSLLHAFLRQAGASPTVILVNLLTVGVGVSLGAGYLFYLAFEQPFIKLHAARNRQAVASL